MALTLEDILKLPDTVTPAHVASLGLLPPPGPSPAPFIPSAKVPTMQPLPQPNVGDKWHTGHSDLELAESIEKSHPKVKPMEPINTSSVPFPGMESPTVPPATNLSTTMAAPNLTFAQRQALPLTSADVAPGSSDFFAGKIARMEDQKANPWGTAENHPGALGKIGHVLGQAANIAGDVLAPGITANIPGSDLNRQVQEARDVEQMQKAGKTEQEARTAEGENKLREAQTQNLESEIREREGAQKQDLVTDAQGNVTGWKDKAGLHALDDPNTPESIKKIAQESAGKLQPEAQQPIGDVSAINKQLQDRYQVLHPGKTLPDEYKVAEGATHGDYARIDKALNAVESAEGTKAQQNQANEIRRQTLELQKQKRDVGEAAIETAAQSLAGGDLTRLKDIASMRGDQRLLIYNRAKELNPKFNPSTVDRQLKMLDEYTTGKEGTQLQSFGTFLEHAGAAKDAADALYNSSVPAFNKPMSWWREHLSGDPNFKSFQTALEPVRKEFEGFLLGGRALYADDRKNAEIIMSESSSPAQINAALKQMGHTVQARYNELDHRFKNTMGKDIGQLIGPLSDEAKQGAKKIGVEVGSKSEKAAKGPEAPEGKTTVYDPNGVAHFVLSDKLDAFLKDPKYQGWSENAPTAK